MLRKSIVYLFGLAAVIMVSASISLAAQTCNGVSVVSTGTTAYTDSGIFVKVRNDSGADCGSLVNGGEMQYFLDNTNVDRTYATILTAVSLNRTMFIQVGGSGEKNSLLMVASIKPEE